MKHKNGGTQHISARVGGAEPKTGRAPHINIQAVIAKGRYFDSYPMMLQAAVEGHGIAVGWARTAGRLVDSAALIKPCAESVFLPQAISIFKRPDFAERKDIESLLE